MVGPDDRDFLCINGQIGTNRPSIHIITPRFWCRYRVLHLKKKGYRYWKVEKLSIITTSMSSLMTYAHVVWFAYGNDKTKQQIIVMTAFEYRHENRVQR